MGVEAGSDDELDDSTRGALPTPQELTRDLHAVQAAVEAVEEAEKQGLLQPWTQTPQPGNACPYHVFQEVCSWR